VHKKKFEELVGDKYIRYDRSVRWDVFCANEISRLSVMVAAGLRCTGLRYSNTRASPRTQG